MCWWCPHFGWIFFSYSKNRLYYVRIHSKTSLNQGVSIEMTANVIFLCLKCFHFSKQFCLKLLGRHWKLYPCSDVQYTDTGTKQCPWRELRRYLSWGRGGPMASKWGTNRRIVFWQMTGDGNFGRGHENRPHQFPRFRNGMQRVRLPVMSIFSLFLLIPTNFCNGHSMENIFD